MPPKRPSPNPLAHPDAFAGPGQPQQQQQRQQQQQQQQQPALNQPAANVAAAENPAVPMVSPKRRRSLPHAPKILPRDYSAVEPADMVILISSMLLELIHFNDQIPLRDGRLTRFHSRSPPRISVQAYLERLTVHATLSPPVLLSMVYYIDRLCALYPAFTISSLTVHRFLISSATVASKGLSDSFWSNRTYAKVGGISIDELALLELEFLFRVEWRIVPRAEVLVDYYLSLVERCEGYVLEKEAPGVGRGLKEGLHAEDSGEESEGGSVSSDEEDVDVDAVGRESEVDAEQPPQTGEGPVQIMRAAY